MTDRSTRLPYALTALAGASLLAGAAFAQTSIVQTSIVQTSTVQTSPGQETPSQARARAATSSLNGGPAESTLTTRANAQPPLSPDERPQPAAPFARPPASRAATPAPPIQATTRTPSQTGQSVAAGTRAGQGATTRSPTSQAAATDRARPGQANAIATPSPETRSARTRPNQTPAAPLMEEPEPISLPLGYYVRGDKDCDEVWPRQGDLAWLTPTSFTIDFGGCEPGQFLQTGPGAWRESQQCHTELGNDAGSYEVTYALTATGTLTRTAHLAIDGSVEEDVWRHCETADVPTEARFEG